MTGNNLNLLNGFAVDYIGLIDGGTDGSGDFTFQSDTTYFVSDRFSCSGTMWFEGGTVIKFPDNNLIGTAPSLLVDTFNCMGDRYRPIILTATDDDTVGASMSGIDTNYTGNPFNSGRNGGIYINMGNAQPLADMRFSFASIAIISFGAPPAPTSWKGVT